MRVVHSLKMDLVGPWGGNLLHMVQGDSNTRIVELRLFSNEAEWIPTNVGTVSVAFKKPDQTKGLYDSEYTLEGNTLQVVLHPQVLTAAGKVIVSIILFTPEGNSVASFPFGILVDKNPSMEVLSSEDYFDAVHPFIATAIQEAHEASMEAYEAAELASEAAASVPMKIEEHNTSVDSHQDIRLILKSISDRLTAFFDSDDQTLDELSEIVAYVTSNRSLINSITTKKVNISDIIDNLTTNVANKPLSAAQGVVLKGLIDTFTLSLSGYQPKGDYALRSELPTVPTEVSAFTNDAGYLTEHQDISGKLDADKLPKAIEDALAQAKESGEFDGEPGKTAYQYAVEGGYTGTEAEFAEKLKMEFLPTSGGTMTGPINMNGQPISGLNPPKAETEPVTKGDGDARYLQKAGGVPVPERDDQAVNRGYVKNAVDALGVSGASRANSVVVERDLGTVFTPEQSEDIRSGKFDIVRTGCYWTINGRKYWAAHADYRLHCGDTELTTHHMLVIPDKSLYNHVMNDTNDTTGSYYGSKMKTSGLANALATVKADFSADHILTHKTILANAVSNGASSGWAWYDSQIDLMNEHMVYGSSAWGFGARNGYDTGIDKSQLALFQTRPDLITNRHNWWLRDIMDDTRFCSVNDSGAANHSLVTQSIGIRPAFLIY